MEKPVQINLSYTLVLPAPGRLERQRMGRPALPVSAEEIRRQLGWGLIAASRHRSE